MMTKHSDTHPSATSAAVELLALKSRLDNANPQYYGGSTRIAILPEDHSTLVALVGAAIAGKSADEGLARDAARYRWLKNLERQSRSNRWPHLYQWPYSPEIDCEKVPQVWEGGKYHPEHLDAAIDAAIADPAAAENKYMRARDAKTSTTGEPKR